MEAVRASNDAPCGTLWFSSHWGFAQRVLTEAYADLGIKAEPIHPYVAWRAMKEQEASDFIVVPSEQCKSTYPDEIRAKAHVAEFGVDSDYFHHDPSVQRHQGPLRVLFPATNPARKGLRFVLEALQQLPQGKVHVTITGGCQGQSMPGVTWAGWMPEDQMRAAYQAHDVVLLPSLEEGQALASLESLACGTPIVVTPEVGLPIEDWKQGRVVPSRSGRAIAEALLSMTDEAAWLGMVREARAFATARPWSKFQGSVLRILREVGA